MTTTPSKPARIRAWLATQDGPRVVAEVAAGIGETKYKAAVALGDMRRAGHVATEGPRGAMRYSLPTGPVVMTSDQQEKRRKRQEAKTAWDRNRKGAMTLAEYNAKRATEKAERKAAKKAEQERARIQREARWAAMREASAAKRAAKPVKESKPARKSRPKATPKVRQPVRPVAPVIGTLTAAPKQAPAMTSADFLAMGGQIERLPAVWERAA